MSITLARLTTAELDADTLDALFSDLALTAIDTVQIKGHATAYAGSAGLDEARRALTNGARGIQICYRWQGETWLDTLLRTATGVRLVRSPLPTVPEEP